MRRLLAASAAWAIGAGVYLVAAVVWGEYDGFPSLLLLPACAGAASAVAVGLALAVGAAVRSTPLGRVWRSSRAWAAAAAAGGAAVLCFGSAAGLTGEYTFPDTGERFVALHPAAAVGGYFLLLFAVANWPRRGGVETESRIGPDAGR